MRSFGSEVGDFLGSDAKNLVAVSGSVETCLLVLSASPLLIEALHPTVHLQIVEGQIGNHLLLDDFGVSLVVDAIL